MLHFWQFISCEFAVVYLICITDYFFLYCEIVLFFIYVKFHSFLQKDVFMGTWVFCILT